MATIQELLNEGLQKLESAGCEYAKYDRRILLEEATGRSHIDLLMHGEEEVPPEREEQYRAWIAARQQHEPLQYLLGYAHFMDDTFYVNEDVLIPRNDTEILVERANTILERLERNRTTDACSVLDLCCGSGCIGISLKRSHPEIALTLADLSKRALSVAEKNVRALSADAQICCGDLYDAVTGPFQMIVCNPPYIASSVIDTLQPEVREYEPRMALDGGADGLSFYRRVIGEAHTVLQPGGYLLLEIGYDQREQVTALMRQHGFENVESEKDYAGQDRVVYGRLRQERKESCLIN